MNRARTLWAKSSIDGAGHSLLGHLLDVGIVADELLRTSRIQVALRHVADDLGLDLQATSRLLTVLSSLHDIGKATPVFQRKWPDGAPPEAFLKVAPDVPHGTLSAIVVADWLRSLGMHRKEAKTLAHAIGVHHGVVLPPSFDHDITRNNPDSLGETPWIAWREALITDVVEAFGPLPEFERRNSYGQARTWAFLAGLTSVADWIGSGLPHAIPIADVKAYVATRREPIVERLREIAWPVDDDWWTLPAKPERFASWFASSKVGADPRQLQLAVQDVLAETEGEQQLLVIEAPMGEGKTEAAFFAAVRGSGVRGAYFGLPTQATSDALYARLGDFVSRHQQREVGVALAHGAARAMAGATQGHDMHQLAPDSDLALNPADSEGVEAAETQARWFSMGRKELLAELGVGTGDQVLLGVLPAKHHFVRLWALAGKVVVLDEVHAYDAYTGGLVTEAVRWLASLGSTIVVMSATLPESTRRELVAAYQVGAGLDPKIEETTDYPRLTAVTSAGVRTRTFEATSRPTVTVRVAPYDLDALSATVLDLLARGGAVGVIVNTVARAQGLYIRCRQAGVEPLLVHAAMPLAERKAREAELLRRFGPGSHGRRDGLVIGTQVMEQSLDIDLDVLVTDLAPIDLVLQRSGRMYRHAGRTERGPHTEPTLYVAGLGTSPGSGPEPDAAAIVYAPYIQWRTWAVLLGLNQIRLPDDLDPLVQRVYRTDEPLSQLAPFAELVAEFKHVYDTKERTTSAVAADELVAKPFDQAVDAWPTTASDEGEKLPGKVKARTRLGEDNVTIVPVHQAAGRWYLSGDDIGVSSSGGAVSREWVMSALMQQMRVSHKGVVQKLLSVNKPAWWTKQKPLRYLVPLLLDENGTASIDTSVRLDTELGLVIEHRRTGRGREE